jgi:tRNA G10  N-methylase Trm11
MNIFRIIITFFCLLFSSLYAQDEKVLTKMERFVSNTGKIVKLENFHLPDLKASYEVVKTKVRRVTIQDEINYFLLLVKEDKYGDKSAAIAEDDLSELIKAFDELIQQSENETTKSDYFENKFTTEDGFQIGYGGSGNIVWFITLEKYGKSTVLFNKYADIKAIFGLAEKKIEELKKGN